MPPPSSREGALLLREVPVRPGLRRLSVPVREDHRGLPEPAARRVQRPWPVPLQRVSVRKELPAASVPGVPRLLLALRRAHVSAGGAGRAGGDPCSPATSPAAGLTQGPQ